MKIAINKCFGGFDLSDEVFEKLIQLGVPTYNDWDKLPNNGDPWIMDKDDDRGILGRYSSNFRDYEKRNHPLLIQALEEVGLKNASGRFGKIVIVDIPDDIEYGIDDYDGIESIHETHRSW